MDDRHFISYSRRQAKDFANRLRKALLLEEPAIRIWLDTRDVRPGRDWDEEIGEAIRNCESLLFVMTRDSVRSQSVCKLEWTRALKYKKPIVPLRLDRDAEMPFRLGSRHYIDFAGDFELGLVKLHNHLQWLASPAGELQTLRDRLEDAERDLERTTETDQQRRIQDEINVLRQQIADQQHIVEDPQKANEIVEENIKTGIEREREPEESVRGRVRTHFINPPPGVVPGYFQDRHLETRLVGEFLKDEALRLMTVVGRSGIGKTAMVCRLLKSLESGRLPDDGGQLSVDGIVYLSEAGSRRVSVPYIYADLCRLLPDDVAGDLQKLQANPQASIEAKMYALLEAFPSGRYVLLLDNFENVIDTESREITDTELEGALRALLDHPEHAVKVILTTRFAPQDMALVRLERQRRIDLDEGLPSPDAENILREMDADGKVGLKTASDELLDEARQRTRGFPRALEALFGILSADRDTTLREILDDTEGLLPDNVVDVLVGEAFSRLDPLAQMVMQALAVYSYPVTSAAVDYLLQPHRTGVNSAPVLSRLVNMQFVRREAGRHYYLHQVDRAYALSHILEGELADREKTAAPPFTRFALLHRAADYLEKTRTPRESWTTIDDLAPQLHEFDLRYAGQDYDTAASVLLEIDFDYLLLWGHYRLVTELHERLQSKLSDPYLEQASLGHLGAAYYNLGRYWEAIAFTERALEIAREVGDRGGEGRHLSNLGDSYAELGQTQSAIDHYEQALEIARQTGYRLLEAHDLAFLGDLFVQQGEWKRAQQQYKSAVSIADEIGYQLIRREGRMGLASAYLYSGDVPAALTSIDDAWQYESEGYDHALQALLGVIALRAGEPTTAQKAFRAALDQAEEHLAHGEQRYDALDSKGLTSCGLALCERNRDRIPAAIGAYLKARTINKDAGVVTDVLRRFDALRLADPAGMLTEVRTAAAGSAVGSA